MSWLIGEGVPLLGWGVLVFRLGAVRGQGLDSEKHLLQSCLATFFPWLSMTVCRFLCLNHLEKVSVFFYGVVKPSGIKIQDAKMDGKDAC